MAGEACVFLFLREESVRGFVERELGKGKRHTAIRTLREVDIRELESVVGVG